MYHKKEIKWKIVIPIVVTIVLASTVLILFIVVLNGYLGLKKFGIRDSDILLCYTQPSVRCWYKDCTESILYEMDPFDECLDPPDRLNLYYKQLAVDKMDVSLCDNIYKTSRFRAREECIQAVTSAQEDYKMKNSDFFSK